jgi:hypothetical protein
MVCFGRMAYLTLEAEINHGQIIVAEPGKLPATGKGLLTVFDTPAREPDWNKVMGLLGTMQNKMDGVTVEREARAEWDDRENRDRENR